MPQRHDRRVSLALLVAVMALLTWDQLRMTHEAPDRESIDEHTNGPPFVRIEELRRRRGRDSRYRLFRR